MTSTIQAKPHYAILDGLRGGAALKLYDVPVRKWLANKFLK